MIKFPDDGTGDMDMLTRACVDYTVDLEKRRMNVLFAHESGDELGMKNLLDRHMFREVQVIQYTNPNGLVHHVITDPFVAVPLPQSNQYEVRYVIYAHAVDGLNTLGDTT